MTLLTERQLNLVRSNCATTKTVLERIRANDALVRINLGREYDALSTKLMAPMNSRIALNKLNGIDLQPSISTIKSDNFATLISVTSR